jgi:tetratricopeptide (TPR) repeat protein
VPPRTQKTQPPADPAQAGPAQKDAELFSSPEKRTFILCLMLVVLTLVLYNSVSHARFVNYDDDDYVKTNSHIHAGMKWSTISWAFQSTEAGNWHPLTWISHAVDYQLFQLNPSGHHYMNLLWHVCNAILLFLMLQRTTGMTWRSLTVAAIFAVHPINVESVAWIAERKNVLCTFFFLLTLWAYGRYVRKPALAGYLAVVFLFAFALMAKPMAVTLPFALLLLDFWPLGRIDSRVGGENPPFFAKSDWCRKIPKRTFWHLVLEKVPLLALSAASAVITLHAQEGSHAVTHTLSFSTRFGNAIVSYWFYIGKATWPAHLGLMYPYQGESLSAGAIAASAIGLLVVTASAYVLRRQRYLIVGWLWFLGILVPMIGLVQVGEQSMADRYAYISFVGLFILAVWAAADWARSKTVAPQYLALAAVSVVLTLSVFTHVQLKYWQDSIAIWSHTIDVTGPNVIAQDNLGVALVAEGEVDEAIPHFQTAVQIYPSDPVGQLNVGIHEQLRGKLKEAIARYQVVLRQNADPRLKIYALENLGVSYSKLGEYDLARSSYDSALQRSPADTMALIGLGVVAQKTGDPAGAAEYYSHAMKVQPSDVGYLLLAHALEQCGQRAEATAASEQARQISNNLDRARQRADELIQ